MSEDHPNYRAYIDGLRAIAVIAVILFHLNPSLFSGGYLGVDVFFVISGFVISQSLYKDYLEKGRINIPQFYKKRFKRLYPALLTMVMVTSVVYVFLGFHWDTNLFIKSALASIFAVSNLYYLKQGDNYFAQDLINPLLHTWSLGIEEQFYILYPILLALGLWLFGRRSQIKYLIWAICIISVFLYLVFVSTSGTLISNFYFPTARFWELGIGCFIFFLSLTLSMRPKRFLAFSSLLLLCCVIIFQPQINNFYIETLIAVVSTAGIIISGLLDTGSKTINLLQYGPVVFMGKLSYSLYLWHLPVIYFSNLYLNGVSFFFWAIIATFLLATLSFYLVEKPLRYSAALDGVISRAPKFILAILLFSSSIVFIVGVKEVRARVNKQLNTTDTVISSFNYIESNFELGERIKPNYRINGQLAGELCNVKDEREILRSECHMHVNNSQVFFLTGDSHALHFLPMLSESTIVENVYYRETPISLITDDHGSIVKNPIFYERLEEMEILKRNYNQVYLLSSFFLNQSQYEPATIKRNIEEYIQSIGSDIHVIFILPTPVFEAGPESCVVTGKYCLVTRDDQKENMEEMLKIYSYLREEYENVHLYDPYQQICPGNDCSIYIKDMDFLWYRDDDHLSVEGSKSLSTHFDSWFRSNFMP